MRAQTTVRPEKQPTFNEWMRYIKAQNDKALKAKLRKPC